MTEATSQPSGFHGFRNRRLAAMTLAAAALALAPAALAQSGPQPGQAPPSAAGANPELMQELAGIRAQLSEIQGRLRTIQQEALAKPEVAKQQNVYEQAVENAILGDAPDMQDKMEKRDALLEELRADPDVQRQAENRKPEVQSRIQEFQKLEQEIAPLRQAANEEPEVQEKRSELETRLIEEMTAIDPETPDLLDKRMQLAQRFQQLQQPPAH